MPVPRSAYAEQAKASSEAFSAKTRNENNEAEAAFLSRNNLPGADARQAMADDSRANLITAQEEELAANEKIKNIKKGTYGYFEPGEQGPQKNQGGRRSRRRRGGAMSDEEKRAIVDDILAAIANAPPDKLQLLKDAVAPIEPPALKVEVADAAKEETPEDGVAKIIALLMKLEEDKLMALKTAIVPKEGGDETEDAAVQRRRQERIAATRARIEAAKQPLSAKVKAAGKTARELLLGILIVLGSAVSSNGGRTRRRRRGSRRA